MIPRPFFPFFTNSCGRLMHIVSKYVGCATQKSRHFAETQNAGFFLFFDNQKISALFAQNKKST